MQRQTTITECKATVFPKDVSKDCITLEKAFSLGNEEKALNFIKTIFDAKFAGISLAKTFEILLILPDWKFFEQCEMVENPYITKEQFEELRTQIVEYLKQKGDEKEERKNKKEKQENC